MTAGERGAARRASLSRLPSGLWIVLLGLVAVLLPWTMSGSNQGTYVSIGLAVMVTVGLTMLVGFAGQISLGQAAFFLFGAYTTGLLVTHGVPTLLALVLAPVATGVIAAVVGIPLLRLQGNYLAFATLALHLIALAVVLAQTDLTGGEVGLQVPSPLNLGTPVEGPWFAALVWLFAVLSIVLGRNLVSSRVGRAFRAIAAGEESAASTGVPVASYKLGLFVIAAAFAGIAGGLYTFQNHYLSPDAFPIMLSVEFLVMAAVGGMGSISGALVGAVCITLLQDYLAELGTAAGLPTHAPQVISLGVYGLILVVVMLYLPRGILPSMVSGGRSMLRARHGQQDTHATTPEDGSSSAASVVVPSTTERHPTPERDR